MSGLTAAQFERLRTWALEVADALLPGTRHHDEANERKFLGTGGLTINRRSGAWYSHSADMGGYSIVALIGFVKRCTTEEAVAWAQMWLANHVGIGACDGDPGGDEDDVTPASAAAARDVLAHIVDIAGTPAESYLRLRRLDQPFPCCAFLNDARCGEHALVGLLSSHQRVAGVQLLYLDPDGRKSTVAPLRRRLMLEKAPDAVFELPYTGDSTDVVVCEGYEDAASVFRYGKRRCRTVGVPGIGVLQHLPFQGKKVTVVRDGDLPGSPADKALQDGFDHLILAGCEVYTTVRPPPGLDANAILQEAGVDGLVAFLDNIVPADLSLRGEIEKLAQLDQLDYAQIRRREAKRLGIPVGILDDEVRKARDRLTAASAPDDEDEWADIQDTPVWLTPVDGVELLDELDKTIGEFIVMTPEQCWTVVLWVVFTHCFSVANNAPKLWIKSAERRSGKTRLMELLRHLTARALASNYISAAMLPRVIEKYRPTLLLDEIDTFINSSEELRGVLNSGFDPESFVIIGTKVGDNWVPKRFSAWCPQALAGLGKLPDTIADRCFTIELARKPREQKVSRLRRRDTGPLQILAQKAVRWAEDNADDLGMVEPEMPPGLNDRASDAWELCIAIADRTGEHWPQRARQAALRISGDDAAFEESVRVQLLADIRDAFYHCPMAYKTSNDTLISSDDLVDWLGGLEERPWPEYRRGRPITKTQLARVIKPFHVSPGTVRTGVSTPKGYKLSAFQNVFSRYLPPLQNATPPHPEENCEEKPDFKTPQGDTCGVSEAAETTNVSAPCGGVANQNPPMEGEIEKSGFEPSIKGNGADPSPPGDGADPPRRRRYQTLGQVAEMIRAIHHQHPAWSVKRIAKATGQPEERIRRALDTESSAE
jgi:putative DNA primase/helicase